MQAKFKLQWRSTLRDLNESATPGYVSVGKPDSDDLFVS